MNGYKRFPEKLKLKIMKEYYHNKVASKDLICKYNLNKDTFKWWCRLYKLHVNQAFSVSATNRTRKFDDSFKVKVVLEYLNDKQSIKSIAANHLIDPSIVRAWIKWYNIQKDNKGIGDMKYYKFTTEKKIEIAKHCIDNNLNYSETAHEYKISYSTVYNWTNKYSKGGKSAFTNTKSSKIKLDKNAKYEKDKKEILKKFEKKKKHFLTMLRTKTREELADIARKNHKR